MIKIGKNISDFSTYSCQPKTRDELRDIIRKRIREQGPNCDLNDIDVSLVTDMSYLFAYLVFKGDISEWDTSKVKHMTGMFEKSPFNGDISNWNTSKVKIMRDMFSYSKFNRDISKWDVSNVTNNTDIFYKCPIKEKYKPKFKK